MLAEDRMKLARYEFTVERAFFRYITQSISGPGWDFDFMGGCLNDRKRSPIFPYGFRLYTEAAPFPLTKMDDYTGIEIALPTSYDEETGEPYFGLKVLEEYDVFNLRLKFLRREGNLYLIEITATVDENVLGSEKSLKLLAWTEEQPDHAYPV